MDSKSAIFIGMGFECVAVVVGFIYAGKWLDTQFGWGGLGVALGAFVGLFSWITHVLLLVRALAKKDNKSHTDPQ